MTEGGAVTVGIVAPMFAFGLMVGAVGKVAALGSVRVVQLVPSTIARRNSRSRDFT